MSANLEERESTVALDWHRARAEAQLSGGCPRYTRFHTCSGVSESLGHNNTLAGMYINSKSANLFGISLRAVVSSTGGEERP